MFVHRKSCYDVAMVAFGKIDITTVHYHHKRYILYMFVLFSPSSAYVKKYTIYIQTWRRDRNVSLNCPMFRIIFSGYGIPVY